jgi:hypothetical protein
MRASSILAFVAVAWIPACDMSNVPRTSAAPSVASAPLDSNSPRTDGGVASGCEAPETRGAIAHKLFLDETFLGYICEETACSEREFSERLVVSEVVLRDTPRTFGCIVGPLHEAMTRIYGVFVLNGPMPSLALIYTGIDIAVDPAFKKPGFKDLVGSERLDPGTWVTHRYVWHHQGYALESTTKAVDGP